MTEDSMTDLSFAFVFLSGVTPEIAGRRKLTEFMTYHVFRDEDRDKLVSVMHGEGVAYEIRRDHRPAGPGFNHRLFVRRNHRLDFIV